MTLTITSFALSMWLGISPPPSLEPMPPSSIRTQPTDEVRSRRLYIASGVLMGAAFLAETTGAVIATTCSTGQFCAVGLRFAWGADTAGTRFTAITTGPGSAYVGARALAIPLVWTGEGLLLAASHVRGRTSLGQPASKRLGWALLGSGLGLYIGSRLARFGFALGGACQARLCAYGFDQATLGVSRALAFSGSAFVMHHRTRTRMQFELGPAGTLGVGLSGQF
jgi:hypothetical protein